MGFHIKNWIIYPIFKPNNSKRIFGCLSGYQIQNSILVFMKPNCQLFDLYFKNINVFIAIHIFSRFLRTLLSMIILIVSISLSLSSEKWIGTCSNVNILHILLSCRNIFLVICKLLPSLCMRSSTCQIIGSIYVEKKMLITCHWIIEQT